MDDVDGNNLGGSAGGKISPPDFIATGGDGYLRTISDQNTTSFGNTSYIDWAISWDYLTEVSTTTLAPGDALRVQFTSSRLHTDHQAINADVAGGASPSSTLTDYWSTEFETSAGDDAGVPEPCSLSLLALAVGAVMAGRWRRRV